MAAMIPYGRPEPSHLIATPELHIRALVTQASHDLRAHALSRAFQGYNHAILFFARENRFAPNSPEGKEIEELIAVWRKWYAGPSTEAWFVGPPGVEKGPLYWTEKYTMHLTRIGDVWTDQAARNQAQRLGSAPPLRYVCGDLCWLDVEADTTPLMGIPIKFLAGIEAHIMLCFDFDEAEGGELVSRALSCRGNCLDCAKAKDSGKTIILQRMEAGEWRRVSNITRQMLCDIAVTFEHLVSRFYGGGAAEGYALPSEEDLAEVEAEMGTPVDYSAEAAGVGAAGPVQLDIDSTPPSPHRPRHRGQEAEREGEGAGGEGEGEAEG